MASHYGWPQQGYGPAPPPLQKQFAQSVPAQPAHAFAPPPAPPVASGALRSVADLPPAFRPVFEGAFRYFNNVQCECFAELLQSSMNVVVAAPTGSGKTVLMELAILQMLSRNIDPASGAYAHRPGLLKAVYLAPARALVQEKAREWGRRFGCLGVSVKEVTGDTDQEDIQDLGQADILACTPEKMDAMSRKHRNQGGLSFFADVALVLIDEVHLLSEDRGASLEAGVVGRVKMISRLREMRDRPIGSVRWVAVSATIPNTRDLAAWLGVPPQGIKEFGEELRPVKLRTVVCGYSPTKTDFLFERNLNNHIWGVLREHSAGKPALVFCSSRKGTSETAAVVAREAGRGAPPGRPSALVRDAGQAARLAGGAARLKNAQLRDCVLVGVGFHHAGMEAEERAVVEELFLSQALLVLCTTSTLAMGVNLPARLVVIKGTRRYVGSEAADASGYQEYEKTTCLQARERGERERARGMVGRAGRPQFDTEGVAVIMTQRQHVQRYQALASGAEVVESTLKQQLGEFLMAEIWDHASAPFPRRARSLGTITDITQAIDWLRSTFFYIRARSNPAQYGVPPQLARGPTEGLDRWLRDKLLLGTVRELAEHGLVRTDDDGFMLAPLLPGQALLNTPVPCLQIMVESYIRMRTMVHICSAPQGATLPDLIAVLAKSAELSTIKLRRSEKKVLNEANASDRLRHHIMNPAKPNKARAVASGGAPVLERISTSEHKVFVLLNEGLADDMEQVVTVGTRIAGAMSRYFSHAGRACEAYSALLLHKCLRQRMWTDSELETRQVSGIGPQASRRLVNSRVRSLRQLAATDPRRLESICQRHYPFGNEVREALARILPPEVSLQCTPLAWASGGLLDLEVTPTRLDDSAAGGGGDGGGAGAAGAPRPSRTPARLLVATQHDNALLLCRSLCLEQFEPLSLRVRTRSRPKGGTVTVIASVLPERLVGVDVAVRTTVPQHARLGTDGAAPGQQLQAEERASPNGVLQAEGSGAESLETEGAEALAEEAAVGAAGGSDTKWSIALQCPRGQKQQKGQKQLQQGQEPRPARKMRQVLLNVMALPAAGAGRGAGAAAAEVAPPAPPAAAAAYAAEAPPAVAFRALPALPALPEVPVLPPSLAAMWAQPPQQAAAPAPPAAATAAPASRWRQFTAASAATAPGARPQLHPAAAAGSAGQQVLKLAPPPQQQQQQAAASSLAPRVQTGAGGVFAHFAFDSTSDSSQQVGSQQVGTPTDGRAPTAAGAADSPPERVPLLGRQLGAAAPGSRKPVLLEPPPALNPANEAPFSKRRRMLAGAAAPPAAEGAPTAAALPAPPRAVLAELTPPQHPEAPPLAVARDVPAPAEQRPRLPRLPWLTASITLLPPKPPVAAGAPASDAPVMVPAPGTSAATAAAAAMAAVVVAATPVAPAVAAAPLAPAPARPHFSQAFSFL
eukprot:scaffold6.g2756.t1